MNTVLLLMAISAVSKVTADDLRQKIASQAECRQPHCCPSSRADEACQTEPRLCDALWLFASLSQVSLESNKKEQSGTQTAAAQQFASTQSWAK